MSLVLVTVDGQRTSAGAAAQLALLKADFRAEFGLDLLLTSGYRTTAEQEAIFRARYRLQKVGNGPYNDVRWWKGQRWVRHSGAGTVAVPGTSRHESAGAADLRDSGRDAGVTVRGTKRANWLRANAPKRGFFPTGYGFGEPWHYDYTWSHAAPAGSGGAPAPIPTPTPDPEPTPDYPLLEEDDMPQIIKHPDRAEWSLLDPDVGKDLPRFVYGQTPERRSEKTAGGVVNTFRGFAVTTDPTIAAAWGRNYCRAYGNAPSTAVSTVDYQTRQAEASRLSHEKHG